MVNSNKKNDVHDFWDKSSCGEELFMSTYDKDNFLFQSKKRYELEPYIADFADFKSTKNKNILEIDSPFSLESSQYNGDNRIPTTIKFLQEKHNDLLICKNMKSQIWWLCKIF